MIVFIGVAGSGKSAQAHALKEKLGTEIISTGDILREKLTGDLRNKMLAGDVMPNEVTIPLIEERIALLKDQRNFVLEGFARTSVQAQWIVDWARSTGEEVLVFHLHASLETVKKRLLSRGRADDTEEAINHRFKVMYTDIIEDIVKILNQHPIRYIDIDAERALEEVTTEIIGHISL